MFELSPFAWGVEYLYQNQPAEFISLKKEKADEYAADHHGIVFSLHKMLLEPQIKEHEQKT